MSVPSQRSQRVDYKNIGCPRSHEFKGEQFLAAVVYGKESRSVDGELKRVRTPYADELLSRAPEFLLYRGDVTDWAGRTFKNITALEYLIWAKDFKMIQMMLGEIPASPEGDEIWAELFKQAEKVQAPIESGGGLTYTHTYDKPNFDVSDIPDGTTTRVTEVCTENHFNITPFREAYQQCAAALKASEEQQNTYWIQFIGRLQMLLPVHILQRYCDYNTVFYEAKFDGKFTRSTWILNYINKGDNKYECKTYFCDTPSRPDSMVNTRRNVMGNAYSDFEEFVVLRGVAWGINTFDDFEFVRTNLLRDLAALEKLDEVGTQEIEKITNQLIMSQLSHPEPLSQLQP